jgi:hypothetical protein
MFAMSFVCSSYVSAVGLPQSLMLFIMLTPFAAISYLVVTSRACDNYNTVVVVTDSKIYVCTKSFGIIKQVKLTDITNVNVIDRYYWNEVGIDNGSLYDRLEVGNASEVVELINTKIMMK